MHAELSFGGQKIRAALDRGVSLAIAVEFGAPGPRHFGAGAPEARPFAVGNFSGSVASGASANCSTLTLTPHCQMTHTESVAHLTKESGDAWRVVDPLAVVIRTLPNEAAKRTRDYSGQVPAYLTREAVLWLVEKRIEHLVLDVPSLDRTHDEG